MKRLLIYSLAVALVGNGYFWLKWQTLQLQNDLIAYDVQYTQGEFDINIAKLDLQLKKLDQKIDTLDKRRKK